MKKIKDMFNVIKYKRKLNTAKNELLSRESKFIKNLEELQDKSNTIIRLQEENQLLKEELLVYKEKEMRKKVKK